MPIKSLTVTFVTTNDNNAHIVGNNILFGESDFVKNQYHKHENIFSNLVELHSNDLYIDDIYHELTKDVPLGCQVNAPNFVILTPGEEPNCNLNIFNSYKLYFKDLQLSKGEHLDVAADEVIFRRPISYHELNKDKPIQLILGQWHTSKAMCATLIKIFSEYGIFSLAAELGAKYLDKLEKVVDYDATFHVLELIWMAVGIALMKHLKNTNKTISDIKKKMIL